jgi:hypothetical protein
MIYCSVEPTPPPEPSPIVIPLAKPLVLGGPTLRQEWILIGVVGLLTSACLAIDAATFPTAAREGTRTPLTWVAVILAGLGHGAWISMDRRRRGLEVGFWRFGAILLGPLVIAMYLAREYGLRALYLIPLAAAIYLMVSAIPMAILLIAGHPL